MTTESLIADRLPGIVDLRHRLHRIPELCFEESKTAEAIRAELDRLKIAYVAGVKDAPTATIATIGDESKPCIALRADIDALPVSEQTGAAYSSTHAGRMHACGHDGHMAMLIGAASVLKARESELPVCVKLIFQPAEEQGGGAERIVNAGVLENVQAVFGLHGWPGLPVGTVATRAGALLAATDNFLATFVGKSCHGAYPHLGADPIAAAAEAITSVQKFVSRETDPTEPCVVTIGRMQGGTAVNIIPETAMIEATVRTLSPEQREHAKKSIERRMRGIASANNCQLNFTWTEGYPATINDPAMADFVAATARKAFGNDRFIPVGKPSMGGEDFAYYLERVPGCFFLVGVQPPGATNHPSLHNDRYDFTDAALPIGMRMFVELAMGFGDGRMEGRR